MLECESVCGFVEGCLRANWVCYLNGLVACIPNAFASFTGHTEQARTVLGFTCERIFVFVGACLHANEACYFNWFYRLRASSYSNGVSHVKVSWFCGRLLAGERGLLF